MNRSEWVIAATALVTGVAGGTTAITHSAAPEAPADRPIKAMGDTPPTEAEALAVLARMVAATSSTDRNRFCELIEPPLICRSRWQAAGGDAAIPSRPPHLLGMRLQDNARVLLLCGTDGTGEHYRSEIPVLYFDGRPQASLGPFWHSFTYEGRFSDGPRVVTASPEPADMRVPPECH